MKSVWSSWARSNFSTAPDVGSSSKSWLVKIERPKHPQQMDWEPEQLQTQQTRAGQNIQGSNNIHRAENKQMTQALKIQGAQEAT